MVQVIYADLPPTVGGMVVKMFDDNGNDDCYTIVLNSNKSHEDNMRSYMHEIEHLEGNDFDNINENVDALEALRHGG